MFVKSNNFPVAFDTVHWQFWEESRRRWQWCMKFYITLRHYNRDTMSTYRMLPNRSHIEQSIAAADRRLNVLGGGGRNVDGVVEMCITNSEVTLRYCKTKKSPFRTKLNRSSNLLPTHSNGKLLKKNLFLGIRNTVNGRREHTNIHYLQWYINVHDDLSTRNVPWVYFTRFPKELRYVSQISLKYFHELLSIAYFILNQSHELLTVSITCVELMSKAGELNSLKKGMSITCETDSKRMQTVVNKREINLK